MMTKTLESEKLLDVSFACQNESGWRTEALNLRRIIVETYEMSLSKPSLGTATIPSGVNAIFFNQVGSLLARGSAEPQPILLAPQTVVFLRGPQKIIIQAARGEHSGQLLSWQGAITPLLENWIQAKGQTRASCRTIAYRPITGELEQAWRRFERAKQSRDKVEPLVLSSIAEVLATVLCEPDEVLIAILPSGLPETISQLAAKVRNRPAAPWPLKEAADLAGYSPFHFSRVFKSLIGYGFHEYVDRVRTEQAIEMLCRTEAPVDLVASSCGFGTTQGLRESIKEYLGLVPSELRSLPEAFDFRTR